MRAASYVAEIDNINSPSDFISFYLVVPSLIKPGLCISWIQYIISVVRVDWTMGDGQLSGSQWMDLIVWIIRSIIIRYFFIGKHLFSNKRRELWRTRLFLSPLLFNLQECLHRQKELNVRPTLHFWQWREDSRDDVCSSKGVRCWRYLWTVNSIPRIFLISNIDSFLFIFAFALSYCRIRILFTTPG